MVGLYMPVESCSYRKSHSRPYRPPRGRILALYANGTTVVTHSPKTNAMLIFYNNRWCCNTPRREIAHIPEYRPPLSSPIFDKGKTPDYR